ncbi:hypothetical protein Aple_072380 [Acrocarpospora pleiomorpha]|uniref:HTH cro/C1-type domain-containing protein n=1 Tax=Acrocarpospora pleiomorpha TaxID=90975 RepID=A0A5M3XW83_9ACTN|nr:helix-turn-helix transcriptional regulator [Acrocarpospora pleiomorpha]GES24339.1 hypothetical protein Aple_072380 [Acrocarpospora pleiomorpha]
MVDIDWPADFGNWLDRLEADARAGDEHSRLMLVFTARALDQLRNLSEPPDQEEETATLRWVRQSRRYPLWRVSHAYHPEVAVRLICWFPPDTGKAVVALFVRGEAMTEPENTMFVRGNEHLDRLLSDPQLAAEVAQAHEAAEEMDRAYAMNLAMIRKAGQMTQVEVARKLGVGQGVVSRLENRNDMLLSTLYDYLMATGADSASIVVTVHGSRIELDLGQLRHTHPHQRSA